MRRKAEVYLLNWYFSQNRKPLILRGARQVGKSTLVRNFCKNNQIHLLEINLESTPLNSLETKKIVPAQILQEIEIETNKIYNSQKSIVFIDEIQAQPRAITALRYFYEQLPEVCIIAAGSLLELILNDADNISFPVGRIEFFYLGPMCFSEFLEASGKEKLFEQFNKNDLNLWHEQLFDLYKLYLAVGGMPEVVSSYFKTKKLGEVRKIQQTLLQTYKIDFPKYAKKADVTRLDSIFSKIHSVVGYKLKYVNIDPDMKARDIKKNLDLLLKAQVIFAVYHTNASGLPIESQKDDRIFKLYFLDVGLWNAAMKTNINEIINGKELISNGVMSEQFIAQHLVYRHQGLQPPDLFYWLKDKDISKAEVDFLIEEHSKIFPIEVKSNKITRLKSLLWFLYEKKQSTGIRIANELFSISPLSEKLSDGEKAVSVQANLITLPHYHIEKLLDLISNT